MSSSLLPFSIVRPTRRSSSAKNRGWSKRTTHESRYPIADRLSSKNQSLKPVAENDGGIFPHPSVILSLLIRSPRGAFFRYTTAAQNLTGFHAAGPALAER